LNKNPFNYFKGKEEGNGEGEEEKKIGRGR
jgi:hypothetical protein